MAQSKHSWPKIMAASIFVFAGHGFVGCGDWPRYTNKPTTNDGALKPGTDPSEGIAIIWADPQPEVEPNNHPEDPIGIGLLDGYTIDGILSGIGWDSDKSVDRVSTCGEALAFPPDAPGDYTGDVDWIAIDPSDAGVLCMRMETEVIDARLDAVLYTLDACGEPTALFIHPDTGAPLGSDRRAGALNWAISVEKNRPLAIAIAGFWPDDSEVELTWAMQLALVPAVSGSTDALCPEPS